MQLHIDRGTIPLILLSGFLGVGKTTLLKRWLTNSDGKRIAVVENEFGEVSIDGALIANHQDGVVELTNGCMCCGADVDVIDTLEKLALRTPRFDAVVVETTGLADVGSLMEFLLSKEDRLSQLYSTRVLTLVSAVESRRMLLKPLKAVEPEEEEKLDQGDLADFFAFHKPAVPALWRVFARQIASADLLVITKQDMIKDDERGQSYLERFRLQLERMSPSPILRVDEVQLSSLLAELHDQAAFITKRCKREEEHEANHVSEQDNHVHGVQSVLLRSGRGYGAADIRRWALDLLNGESVWRIKGLLECDGEICALQGVGSTVELEPADAPALGVVLIGTNLNHTQLQASLDAL